MNVKERNNIDVDGETDGKNTEDETAEDDD